MYRHPERRYPDQKTDPLPDAPTRRQQAFLVRNQLHPDHEIDFYDAAQTISRFVQTRRELSPTVKQEKFLKGRGKWRDGMTRGEAFDLIRHLTRVS